MSSPMARWSMWWRTLPLAAFGGAVTATSPVPLEWTPVGFVGPLFLLAAIEGLPGERPSPRRAFVAGWVFSSVVSAIALYWVVGLLMVFGGFPWFAAVPVALLLWVAQGLGWGIAGWWIALLRARGVGWWVVPLSFVVASSWTPSLFPWRLGNSQIGWPVFIQVAELGGEPLVDLAVVTVAAGLYEALMRRDRLAAVTAAAAFLVPLVYGAVRLPMVRAERAEQELLRVGVVQPNVGIFEKRDPRLAPIHIRQLQSSTRALEDRGADLVVWPESAYPYRIDRRARGDVGPPHPLSIRGGFVQGPVLFGALTIAPVAPGSEGGWQTARYNSVVAMDQDGRFVGISDKVELLAFGEYTPLWDYLPPLQERFPRGLTPGEAPEVLTVGGTRVGVLNCYEDVLPHHARWVARREPGFLLNVTNDAWFGETTEPFLHQMVARMRSVETRRDLVRAVNTGVSSHTLATGEDAVRTPIMQEDAFIAEVRLMRTTTLWTRFGDWVTPLLAVALLAVAWRARGRRS